MGVLQLNGWSIAVLRGAIVGLTLFALSPPVKQDHDRHEEQDPENDPECVRHRRSPSSMSANPMWIGLTPIGTICTHAPL
jgi:hypothetical protein